MERRYRHVYRPRYLRHESAVLAARSVGSLERISRRRMSSRKKRARSEGTSDRVFLNVGGEVFQTTVSTLTANSQFFSRKFSSEWSTEDAEDEIFLDRDADSFRVLLSCMRHRTALLPEEDQLLCARVLLEYIQSGSNPRL